MSLNLEESTLESISPILEKLSREVISQNKSMDSIQKDLFHVLIIVLMLENEFSPILNNSEVLVNVNSIDVLHLLMTDKLHTRLYETKFVLSGFNDLTLKLIISPLGALMLINLIFSDINAETYSVCLPISRYVVSPQASTIPMIFRDLKHLSITFKNNVLSAVKSRILSYYGHSSASLVGLPDELIQYNVLLYLPVADIINVSKTCKRLEVVVGNKRLWREMYKRDFKNESPSGTDDWKIQYKKTFLAHKEKKTPCSHSMRSMMNYQPDLFSYLDYNMALYSYNPLYGAV